MMKKVITASYRLFCIFYSLYANGIGINLYFCTLYE